MKIINLVENTEGQSGCRAEHGLCFYIETIKHKILMDTGQTDLLIENADKLGVDLNKVDTVVLSHGHYDHSGGIIPFSKINNHATIYVKDDAFGEYYSTGKSTEPRYIGIDPEIRKLSQVVLVSGSLNIDEELSIFSQIGSNKPSPLTNKRLYKKDKGELVNDDFSHEQCLVIKEGGKKYLFSGCAHHGVLNILDRYEEIYNEQPCAMFSGMHTMRKTGLLPEDVEYIEDTAKELTKYETKFYTCHCTGEEPYKIMKDILKEQMHYVHCGDALVIR